MILYGSTLSPFVRKVAAYCTEKGLAFDLVPTGFPTPSPEFLAASPFRKMPALVDGEFSLSDSTAIIHYLEAKHPEPALIPADPEARGRTIWFDEFADTIIGACNGKMFFNRIVGPRFMRIEGDEAVAAAAERDELPPILDYLEKVAPDAGGFLVGDALTLADLAVASPFANMEHMAVAIDPARHPRALAYIRSILQRPSFAPLIAAERAMLERVSA